MAGGDRRIIVNQDVSLVASLTIDYKEQILFWADINRLRIERADFDGSNRKSIVEGYRAKGLDIYGNWLYFTDPLSNAIYRMEKHSGRDLKALVRDVRAPNAIKIVAASSAWT